MSNKSDPYDIEAGVPEINGDLRPKPKVADRISKRVIFVVLALLAVLAGIFLFSLDSMDRKKKSAPVEKTKAPEKVPEVKDDSLGLLGAGDSPPGSKEAKDAKETKGPVLPPNVAASDVDSGGGGGKSPGKGGIPASAGSANGVPAMGEAGSDQIPPSGRVGGVKPLTPAQQLENQEKLERLTRMKQARTTGLSGKTFGDDKGGAGSVDADAANMLAAAREAAAGTQPVNFPAAAKGDGEQDSKLDFLKGLSKEESRYHPHVAMPALSPNEVKTGSFIPMVLEQGINSDLPGQITARVTEDVYDSITGCRMLIPAMSKVVGRYDSKVAIGQGRMLVAWSALVFPNGDELNLAGMQGYDTSGQAGLESDVDNHYWRMFGLTFGLSMITAGVQLSVPAPEPSEKGASTGQTPSQIIAAALAQQYGTLGAQILGKYMAVQPTLRNFAGERFMVMVPRSIIFRKVWRNRCSRG